MKTEETRTILNFLEWECLDERTKKVNVYRTPFTKYVDKGNYKEVIHTNIPTNSEAFKKDWNFLMEVVEKIRKFHNGTEPLSDKQIEQLLQLIKKLNESLTLRNGISIEAVYNACVEFIKWYNEQK